MGELSEIDDVIWGTLVLSENHMNIWTCAHLSLKNKVGNALEKRVRELEWFPTQLQIKKEKGKSEYDLENLP